MPRATRAQALSLGETRLDEFAGLEEILATIITGLNPDGSPFSLPNTGIADTLAASGSLAAPAANTTIATLGDVPDGVYSVEVTTFQAGTVDANRLNAQLRDGTATVSDLLTLATPNTVRFPRVTMSGTDVLLLRTGAAVGGAGSVYAGSITATRVE